MTFDICQFQPESHTVLGQGVWGCVYDLNDDTVLKLCKQSGGVGDGLQKVCHEIDMMKALSTSAQHTPFGIPTFIDSGKNLPTPLSSNGYAIWLRSKKISGKVLKIEQIQDLPKEIKVYIAQSLSHALYEFHVLLDQSKVSEKLQKDAVFDLPGSLLNKLTPKDRRYYELVIGLIKSNPDSFDRAIHGDFNISNILFDDKFKVSGILDFAEMCLGCVEDDIASLTSELPFLKDAIVEHYESISGTKVNAERLRLAEIKRSLIGLLICRYQLDRAEEAEQNERYLASALQFGIN